MTDTSPSAQEFLPECQDCGQDRAHRVHRVWVYGELRYVEFRGSRRLRLYRPKELAEKPGKPEWLIRGVWQVGSAGPLAGPRKTLKTYCAMIHAIAVASGEDSFGHPAWKVPKPRPVLYFCAEGGIDVARRRLQRIAREVYGIHDITSIPLYLTTGAESIASEGFAEELQEQVGIAKEEYGELPALVIIDPLYAYHPQGIEVTNLYDRGPMLANLQELVERLTDYQAALWVLDHFNKTGQASDIGLDRIAQAGMGPWADTWWEGGLRDRADFIQNAFKLNVEVGSRRGYAGHYEVDITLGVFDVEACDYDGAMKVEVREVGSHTWAVGEGRGRPKHEIAADVMGMAEEARHTREEIVKAVPGSAKRVREEIDELVSQRLIEQVKLPRQEDGRMVTRPVYRRTESATIGLNPVGSR